MQLTAIWVCVLGLHGQVLVVVGTTAVTSVRSYWKLPQCPTKPMPGGSKTGPLLAKAKPIRGCGNSSEVSFLRREKKIYCPSAAEREE